MTVGLTVTHDGKLAADGAFYTSRYIVRESPPMLSIPAIETVTNQAVGSAGDVPFGLGNGNGRSVWPGVLFRLELIDRVALI